MGLVSISLLLNFMFMGVNTSLLYSWTADDATAYLVGFVASVISVGSVVGGVSASRIIAGRPGGRIIRLAVVMSVVTIMLIPVVRGEMFILALLCVASLPLPCFNAVLGGFMVATVPSELQGRVAASSQLIAIAVTPLAPRVAGYSLGSLSLSRTLMIFAGAGLIGALLSLALPSIRAVGRPSEWATWRQNGAPSTDQQE